MTSTHSHHAILLISCPDRMGLTAAVTQFVFQHNGNIIHADQHIDDQSNTFFMRIEWSLAKFDLTRDDIRTAFRPLAEQYQMTWRLHFSDQPLRLAIYVSKHLHCLTDILYRHRSGQLACDIPLIISNHTMAEPLAREYGARFHCSAVTPETKHEQELAQLKVLTEEKVDIIVLARYHQILTGEFVNRYPNRIINIHHSFLPAFAGGHPYRQAYDKGVKLIGATSHYVVEALDDGPIIEQATVRVSHRDALSDLVRKGEDLEKLVLSRALFWQVKHKILSYGRKTVIFD